VAGAPTPAGNSSGAAASVDSRSSAWPTGKASMAFFSANTAMEFIIPRQCTRLLITTVMRELFHKKSTRRYDYRTESQNWF